MRIPVKEIFTRLHRNLISTLAIASLCILLPVSPRVGHARSLPETFYPPALLAPQADLLPVSALNAPLDKSRSPDFPPSPCGESRGRVLEERLESYWLGSIFSYRIYLPPCYSPTLQPGYPVLYLIHGMGSTDDQWDRMGIDEAADRLIASGQIDPLIIVMPFDNSYAQPTQDPFDEALTGELIPWIDRHYNSRPERAFRAVGGLSRGASWALHLGLVSPEIFGAVGAHSLPIFWEDASQVIPWLENIPPEALPRLYLDIGRGDTEVSAVMQFEASLAKSSIPHEFHLNNGYHEEAYWAAHLDQYLRWYSQGWEDRTQ